ncbi:MAG: sigma 54-interacting transcriptional regulator [Verrucomicrobiales bacterium]|nr:sigma 54-interacting transcriptional regulator [Verrucomicrobiales bacterium]
MHTTPRVLIVEDERALAIAFAAAVRQSGAASELAPTAAQARRLLRESPPFDALILDIGLPDENGLAFLASLTEAERLPTLVVTAHGEIGNTIAARKLGVREFFTKPLDFATFTGALATILRPAARRAAPAPESDSAFLGAAPAMRPVFRQIAHACASDEPVLLRGETGSGKTRVARLIREYSREKDAPFVLHAAGAAPLAEALTNAQDGVLVVEDLTSLPADEQALLVRGIEADDAAFPRLLATVSSDLATAVTGGTLRSDLYYRLQVLEVSLPPLRERREDLPALADFFAAQLAPGRHLELDESTLSRLLSHDWPGNLRELRNVVSFALTAAAGSSIIASRHLPTYLVDPPVVPGGEVDPAHLPEPLIRSLRDWIESRFRQESVPTYRELSEALETGLIRELLPRYGGRLARLATELQANRATLRKRLKKTSLEE